MMWWVIIIVFAVLCIMICIINYIKKDIQDNTKEKEVYDPIKEEEHAKKRILDELDIIGRSKFFSYPVSRFDLSNMTLEQLRSYRNAVYDYKNKGCFYDKDKSMLHLLLYANPKKQNEIIIPQKSDWLQFREYLESCHIGCFFHFTDISNLKSIIDNGGLYSWKYCAENNINIPKAGGGNLSRELDTRYNLEDYIRLSFCADHPMTDRLKQSGYNLVLLLIKIDVAWFEETLFSDMNATDDLHHHGSLLEDLKKVDITAARDMYVEKTSPKFKKHQAEVLVKRFIPLKYIINIYSPKKI